MLLRVFPPAMEAAYFLTLIGIVLAIIAAACASQWREETGIRCLCKVFGFGSGSLASISGALFVAYV